MAAALEDGHAQWESRRRRLSSVASSSRGGRCWSSPSPVLYRENPMSYEPAKYYICRKKAPRWISWSPNNPGRRLRSGCNGQLADFYVSNLHFLPLSLHINFLNSADLGMWVVEWHHDVAAPSDLCDAVWRLQGQVACRTEPNGHAVRIFRYEIILFLAGLVAGTMFSSV